MSNHNVICLQPDDTHIAAGMSDGTLSVRRRQPRVSEDASDLPFSPAALRSGTFESFLGGTIPSIGQGRIRDRGKIKSIAAGDADEFRVESRRAKRLKEFDRLLKGFKYSAALDSVLRKVGRLALFLVHFNQSCVSASPSHDIIRSYTRADTPRWPSKCLVWT